MQRKIWLASLLAMLASGGAHAALPSDGYVYCAKLGETCVMTGTHDVELVGDGDSSILRTVTGNFPCTNAYFDNAAEPYANATCWVGPVPSTTPPPTTPGEQFPTQPVPADQIGYANIAITSLITGNFSGSTVVVKTFNELKAAAANTASGAPVFIHVSGTIRGTGVINVARFKHIRGLPGSALDGFGLAVHGTSLAYNDTAACDDVAYNYNNTRNVVLQNLTIKNASGVAISVTCGGHHVWIDHNTIIKPRLAAIAITRGADYVTASWNRIVDAEKALLVGHENSARQTTQSKGRMHLSYHHNWHDGVTLTHSLTYYGTVHAYNNYLQGTATSYFLGVANDANIHAEANSGVSVGAACKAFEGASRSHVTYKSDNIVRDKNGKLLECKVTNDGLATKPPYSGYPISLPENVPAVVKQGAGAGKVVF
ncbi:MAG: hypothetical protein QM776_14140 [Rhodocyclaceae bacterium]